MTTTDQGSGTRPRVSDETIGALTQAARDSARNGEGPAVTAAVDAVCCAVEQLADEVFRMRATYDGMLNVSRALSSGGSE